MKSNRIKLSRGDRVFTVINYTVLALVLIAVIYPLVFFLSASFSEPTAIYKGELWLLPKGFNLEAYKLVLKNQDILIGYRNTIFYTITGTIINLIMTVLGAYPLSRPDLKGKNPLMFLFTFTMLFSGGLVPTYLVIHNMNLYNTAWAILLPSAISVYNLIIMRTFFQNSIPQELIDAASIDGCGNLGALFRVVLPLSQAIIAVMTLFYAVAHWNAYFNALIYLNDRDKLPLQLILRQILIQNDTSSMTGAGGDTPANQILMAEAIKYSSIVISSAPLIILYPFLQKYFAKGVMLGAIKG